MALSDDFTNKQRITGYQIIRATRSHQKEFSATFLACLTNFNLKITAYNRRIPLKRNTAEPKEGADGKDHRRSKQTAFITKCFIPLFKKIRNSTQRPKKVTYRVLQSGHPG